MILMIYDISMLIHEEMQTYKNNQQNKPLFTTNQDHQTGNVHDTTVTLNLHTGTHMDFPLHMIKDGDSSHSENLEPLIGEAKVLDFVDVIDHISKEDLEKHNIQENDFLLFKTKSSYTDVFLDDFVYLEENASIYLKEIGVRGVGTDALGIERAQKNHPTHKTLLENGIIILEGLRLKEVPAGTYQLIFLPLKLKNTEAALGRAVLIKD
jgi:arylformamidase